MSRVEGPRRRRGSCWEERKRIVFPNEGSLICLPGKSMSFHKKETEKNELVARPEAINPSLYCTVYYKPGLGNGCCTINAFLGSSNLATPIQVTTWLWISVALISNPCNNYHIILEWIVSLRLA